MIGPVGPAREEEIYDFAVGSMNGFLKTLWFPNTTL